MNYVSKKLVFLHRRCWTRVCITLEKNTTNLSELASLADAFYIGGTKNGALFGEALVICRQELQADFSFSY